MMRMMLYIQNYFKFLNFLYTIKISTDASNIKIDYLPSSLIKNNIFTWRILQKEKSFYKPYIDIILLNDYSNYTPFLKKDDFFELNDQMVENNTNYYINEINDYYQQIFKKKKKTWFILFKSFYIFDFSRKFNIGDSKTFLIPLVDLLNNSPYLYIKYEFLDSKNLVMKYSIDFNDNNNLSKDIVSNNLQNFIDFSDSLKYFNINKKDKKVNNEMLIIYNF